jgi:hypothetical protein
MAYFLWDDTGVTRFLERYEPGFTEQFSALAANVERSDVFRVLVSKHIGGIVRPSFCNVYIFAPFPFHLLAHILRPLVRGFGHLPPSITDYMDCGFRPNALD